MLQRLFFQGKAGLFHEFLLNLNKAYRKASLPETPTKSSRRIQTQFLCSTVPCCIHCISIRFQIPTTTQAIPKYAKVIQSLWFALCLPQFPRAICWDYPPESQNCDGVGVAWRKVTIWCMVLVSGGFCVTLDSDELQSLHNAPRDVSSALPVTSIVWNTDLKTEWYRM